MHAAFEIGHALVGSVPGFVPDRFGLVAQLAHLALGASPQGLEIRPDLGAGLARGEGHHQRTHQGTSDETEDG